ncbi:hypothetical protein [Paenibacillus sp. FSL R7-0333]|uniref:hypothetical protein n=1 Tax=Paenibacillus sp. FSL R7-0333 TaxID=1926587 RepID=UPI00096BEA04|nr:hypothetical protein BK146_27815 [Paenibacillus sp. FSL R7-0333]
MDTSDKVFGAQSKVFIQYEGSLEELGLNLKEGLNILDFRYDNIEEEPYDWVGYAEVLGFEMVLKTIENCEKWPGYQYILEVFTTDSFQEIFNDRMYDISQWMARHIALVCEVATMAEILDENTGKTFIMNRENWEMECSLVESYTVIRSDNL